VRNFLRLLQMTFLNLSCHAFRAFLAALGVVLGVGAVVAMMAISEGGRRESIERIRAMGIDSIVIRSVKPTQEGTPQNNNAGTTISDYGLKAKDVTHLLATFENIRQIIPIRDMQQRLFVGGLRSNVRVMATTPEFLNMTFSELADSRGRWITDVDELRRNPVCVVGIDAARTLFGIDDPLNQTVHAGGGTFQVVGVLRNARGAKLAGQYDLNNLVYIPFATGNAVYGRMIAVEGSQRDRVNVEYDFLYIKVIAVSSIPDTVKRLRSYLDKTRATRDFEIQVPYELMLQEESTQRVFRIVMGSIAAISLLVGGIGIMNIMLANIFERTREIGTRRALGAKKRDILFQFLLESTILTALGGGIGLSLGVAIARLVEHFTAMHTAVTLPSVLVSLAVSIITGMVFGTYPAWKAANLDPIEALRHE
jgi:putative ABC transport system permease protein